MKDKSCNGLPDLDYGLLHGLTGHLLRHAFNRGQAAFSAAFEGKDVTALQFMIMELVTRNPGVSHSEICAAMGSAASVLTTTLKPLLALGYIQSCRDPEDTRRTVYCATDKGTAWFGNLRPQIADSERRLTERLSAAETAELNRILKLLTGIGS